MDKTIRVTTPVAESIAIEASCHELHVVSFCLAFPLPSDVRLLLGRDDPTVENEAVFDDELWYPRFRIFSRNFACVLLMIAATESSRLSTVMASKTISSRHRRRRRDLSLHDACETVDTLVVATHASLVAYNELAFGAMLVSGNSLM